MADTPQPSGQLRPTTDPVTSAADASNQALHEALGSSFVLVRILVVLLLGAFVFSCVFTVNPNEVAVVLRFGKPVGTGPAALLKPGLHWAFPYPVDEIVRIRVGEAKTVVANNAWYATSPEMEASGAGPEVRYSLMPGVDGHTLTSDGNILHVRAILRYTIADPVTYAFRFTDVTNLLANALNNALYQTSARFEADATLYRDVAGFRSAVRDRMQQLVELHQFGIKIDDVTVDARPPGYVKESFDAVLNAAQTRSKTISEAQGFFDETVLTAQGEASAIRQGGISASNKLMEVVGSEVKFFRDQLPYYEREPGLLRSRLHIDALAQILTNAPDKFFISDRADGRPRELRLQLNREPLAAPGRKFSGQQPAP